MNTYSNIGSELESLAQGVGGDLYLDSGPTELGRKFRDYTCLVRAKDYRQASADVRGRLHAAYWDEFNTKRKGTSWLASRAANAKQAKMRKAVLRNLKENADLGYVLLHHGNGYMREAGLRAINDPLMSVFEVVTLVDLANNWVPQVREQAMQAIARCFPKTDANLIAQAFPFLLTNMRFWSRWAPASAELVESLFYQDLVQLSVIDLLLRRQMPFPERALSILVRRPFVDDRLHKIWTDCPIGSVRAKALRILINRQANWADGFEYKWIDKSLGQKQRVRKICARPLSVALKREPLIERAAGSKSIPIRKVAVQALIDFRSELQLPVKKMAKQFAKDRAVSVRSRADYLLRVLADNG